MPIHDYNGKGDWAATSVRARYESYASQLKLPVLADLEPRSFSKGDTRWIYPIMERVIEGIESGDPACAELGIDFISESGSFPFGMLLKSKTARALRRSELSEPQKQRIRRRVVQMLIEEYLPREFKEYAKLLRKIGIANMSAALLSANTSNPYVARYIKLFENAQGGSA
jgi:hypothetical protein